MTPLILFYLLRILAISFFIVNLVLVDASGVAGVFAVIVGLFACINLYAWGLFKRETNGPTPGIFILFRVIQGFLVFLFDALPLSHYATYVLMDIVFFALLIYDSRYSFIYREPEEESDKIKTQ